MGTSLSIKKGEKLSTSEGAGLTEKGRRKYNRENGSNLQAPVTKVRSKKDQSRRNSFCARMNGIRTSSKNNERATASMKRWNCPQVA